MPRCFKWLDRLLSGFAFLTLALMLRNASKPFGEDGLTILSGLEYFLILLFLIYLGFQLVRLSKNPDDIQRRLFDLAIFLPLVLTKGEPQISATLIIFRQIVVLLYRLVRQEKVQKSLFAMQRYPARMMAGSFLILIALGTLLLALPFSTESGQGMQLIDALFTATSATCVTGLIVVDTPTYFSTFGEIVILILIQAGGLGIMALSASAAVLLGKRMAVGQKIMVQSIFEESDYETLKKAIFYIIRFTFVTELIGALVLMFRFRGEFNNILQAAYFSIFHSVSAFCNAGFALWSNSLEGFVHDPIVNLTISILIILGGIGFTVVGPLLALPHLGWEKRQNPLKHISLHSRLVLLMTVVLLLAGTLFFLFIEYNRAFVELDLTGKIIASFFHSVTARTAGFNTVDLRTFHVASLFFFTLLMFVGASPGSTGGGIKTTTLATLALTARSMIRKRSDVELFGRRISDQLITKAIAIFTLSLVVIPLGTLLLLVSEEAPFQEILFEVISAFGTVGLTLGLTPKLTLLGKLFISILMFVGRLGPLSIALGAGEGTKAASFRYPKGEILVG